MEEEGGEEWRRRQGMEMEEGGRRRWIRRKEGKELKEEKRVDKLKEEKVMSGQCSQRNRVRRARS